MIKITGDDIQQIVDENALMGFLREKLNMQIPADLNLEDITTKFSNFALGFNEKVVDQIIDCQELGVTPGQPSDILLIRFNSKSRYPEVLRTVAESLDHRRRNPIDLRIICTDENYQPFAFAYFKDSTEENSVELNILAWTQENTNIHIGSEHAVPDVFLFDESSEQEDDDLAVEEAENLDEIDVIRGAIEDNIEGEEDNRTSDKQTESGKGKKDKNFDDTSAKNKVQKITADDLLEKLDNIGTLLSTRWEIHRGIITGCNRAFVIDETKRQQLIDEHPQSAEIIKLGIGKHQENQWRPDHQYLISIPSSKNKQWPWTDAKNASAAKSIFTQTYPAISNHLDEYENDLKRRFAGCKGKFYWELSMREDYPEFRHPKIIFYDKPPVVAFYDESDAIVVSPFVHSIQTDDFSLLAIFNSKFFRWYSQTKYEKKGGGRLNKTNLKNFPTPGTKAQKTEISRLVEQILSDPNSPNVPDLEEDIDRLVYDLYKLTASEIALITDSLHFLEQPKDAEKPLKTEVVDTQQADGDDSQDQAKTGRSVAKPQKTESRSKSPKSEEDVSTDQSVDTNVSANLLAKLDGTGTPLAQVAEIYGRPSIQPGCSEALVLDEAGRQQLIAEDAQSRNVIIPVVCMPRDSRWEPEWKHVIWFSSSEFKQWPWSDAKRETEAEKIFTDTYPAISQHIRKYKKELKNSSPSSRGQFYWELPLHKEEQKFYHSKIIYPADGVSLDAGYDTSGSFILGNSTFCIPTTDLSLLAILNSTVFDWFANVQYQATHKRKTQSKWLSFKKEHMQNFPIADRTTDQIADLSDLIEQIFDDPYSPDVPDLEEEINELVYDLYKLRSAEIKLIEKESNQ